MKCLKQRTSWGFPVAARTESSAQKLKECFRTIEQTRNMFCRTKSLSNATFFHFWSRDVHPVQNLLLCTKFQRNSLKYGDISIFKMAGVRHLGIVLPPYDATNSLLLAAAACQISCQSDAQIWRYSYLNFSHIWLERPMQAPKMRVWGEFGPPKCDYSSSRPQ